MPPSDNDLMEHYATPRPWKLEDFGTQMTVFGDDRAVFVVNIVDMTDRANAKLIVHAVNRGESFDRMREALEKIAGGGMSGQECEEIAVFLLAEIEGRE